MVRSSAGVAARRLTDSAGERLTDRTARIEPADPVSLAGQGVEGPALVQREVQDGLGR